VYSRGPGVRRQTHVEAEIRYRANPKPIGELWQIGAAQLRYPRDPNGPPGEIINCQCMAIGKRFAAEGGGKQLTVDNGQLTAESLLAAQLAEGFVQVAAVSGLLRKSSASSAQSADDPPGENNE
jgi:hypothetical protein